MGDLALLTATVYEQNITEFEENLGKELSKNIRPIVDAIITLTPEWQLAFFNILIQHGWKINEPRGYQEPTILAYVLQHIMVVEWFLACKANVNMACMWGLTPLTVAVYQGSCEVIKLLFKHGGDPNQGGLLHQVIIRKDGELFKIMDLLSKEGADTNQIQFSNNRAANALQRKFGLGTPPHKAVQANRLNAVQYLVDRGADLNVTDTKGRSALQIARSRKNSRIVEYLIAKGAKDFQVNQN